MDSGPSNNTAIIVLTPFAVEICYAISECFLIAMGYQTNLMVYGPGGYRFVEYINTGLFLNTVFWLITSRLLLIF